MSKYKNNKGLHKDFVQTMRGTRISGISINEDVTLVTEDRKRSFLEKLGLKKTKFNIKINREEVLKVKRGEVTFLY